MAQCLLYIFFMEYNIILIIINNVIIYSKDADNSFLPPSVVSVSRTNFVIASSVIIPTGWFLSYFFLWIYFKLDKGFFSDTSMRFKYENNKADRVIAGEWKDLS